MPLWFWYALGGGAVAYWLLSGSSAEAPGGYPTVLGPGGSATPVGPAANASGPNANAWQPIGPLPPGAPTGYPL